MTEFNITIYVLTQSGAPAVLECITIDTSLHVSLSYDGHVILLPECGFTMDKIAPSQGSACLKILHRI